MRTIEERAKEYAAKCHGSQNTEWGFIAGAESEHEELTRWHNPKEELPNDGHEVLCMIHKKYNTYIVLKYYQGQWWQQAPVTAGGWCGYAGEIIAWREIHE